MLRNWRGESAKKCWMCGSLKTYKIDSETRCCKKCGTEYAIERTPT